MGCLNPLQGMFSVWDYLNELVAFSFSRSFPHVMGYCVGLEYWFIDISSYFICISERFSLKLWTNILFPITFHLRRDMAYGILSRVIYLHWYTGWFNEKVPKNAGDKVKNSRSFHHLRESRLASLNRHSPLVWFINRFRIIIKKLG